MINCTIIGKFDSPTPSASLEHWDNSQLRVSSEIIESQISLENVRRRPSCHNKSLDFSCILIAAYTLSSPQNYGWFTSIRRRFALRREGTWFGALLQGIRPHQGYPDQERLRIRGKHRIIIIYHPIVSLFALPRVISRDRVIRSNVWKTIDEKKQKLQTPTFHFAGIRRLSWRWRCCLRAEREGVAGWKVEYA